MSKIVICEYCGEKFEKYLNEQCCFKCYLKADKINKAILNGTFESPQKKDQIDLFEV